MTFDHEKLNVYQVSLEFVSSIHGLARALPTDFRHARDQLLRASLSIPLNIAEGNGKRGLRDRSRFFEIARGSAMECAAVLDVLVACKAQSADKLEPEKLLLHRIVSMLSKMTERTSQVREEEATYPADGFDYEHEHEHEHDGQS